MVGREFQRTPTGAKIIDYENGAVYRSAGRGRHAFIWPIEEYLTRTKHRRRVRERIARLNPAGKEEGDAPKGWHPHHRAVWGTGWLSDLMGRSAYERKFGAGSYGRLPRDAFIKTGGKRKAITRLWLVEHGCFP